MHSVCRAVLKNDSVCIRKGTWTDGPAPAGPLLAYMCPIKSLHFIPFYQSTHLYPFLKTKKRHDTLKGKVGMIFCRDNFNLIRQKKHLLEQADRQWPMLFHISHFISCLYCVCRATQSVIAEASWGEWMVSTEQIVTMIDELHEREGFYLLPCFLCLPELYFPQTAGTNCGRKGTRV